MFSILSFVPIAKLLVRMTRHHVSIKSLCPNKTLKRLVLFKLKQRIRQRPRSVNVKQRHYRVRFNLSLWASPFTAFWVATLRGSLFVRPRFHFAPPSLASHPLRHHFTSLMQCTCKKRNFEMHSALPKCFTLNSNYALETPCPPPVDGSKRLSLHKLASKHGTSFDFAHSPKG